MNPNEEILTLISKFLAGEASPEEAMMLEDWKEEKPENQAYYNSCEQIFFGKSIGLNPDQAWKKVESRITQQKPKIRKLFFGYSQIAAILILTLLMGGIITYILVNNSNEQSYYSQNQKRDIQLEDGTQIQLSKNSELKLDDNYNQSSRKVSLKGSAYFTVQHDEKKQFIIDAGPIFIKDLGTKFDVKTVSDTIYIRVDEGSVLIYNEKGLKITLEAHEQAYYVISNGTLKITVENDSYIKRAPIKLIFENQSLKTIVAGLNQMYTADIRLGNPALENCRMTTQFNDEKLEIVLEIIAETLELTVEKKDGTYILNGKGC